MDGGTCKRLLVLGLMCLLSIVGLAGLVGGCVILPLGLKDIEDAWVLRNDTDLWEKLSGSCNVTFVKKCWQGDTVDSIEKSSTGCWRFYVPRFTTAIDSRVLSGWREKFEDDASMCPRSCSDEDAGAMPSGDLVVGRSYDCWRPRSTLDPRYECGSPSCIKIGRDPNLIRIEAMEKARKWVMLGGGSMLLGLLACCIVSCLEPCLETRSTLQTLTATSMPTIPVVSEYVISGGTLKHVTTREEEVELVRSFNRVDTGAGRV